MNLSNKRELPDVAMLQTTFDFDRRSDQGALLPLDSEGIDDQIDGYAHEDRDYVSALMLGFMPTYSTSRIDASVAPTSYLDFLNPEYADGNLALTYPHDDDAVLYVCDKLRDTYGDEFLEKLRDQDPTWVRGTAVPAFMVSSDETSTLGNLPGTDPFDFIDWMADREAVATVRSEMEGIFGPVERESPLLDPALLEFLDVDPADANAEPEPEGPIL